MVRGDGGDDDDYDYDDRAGTTKAANPLTTERRATLFPLRIAFNALSLKSKQNAHNTFRQTNLS